MTSKKLQLNVSPAPTKNTFATAFIGMLSVTALSALTALSAQAANLPKDTEATISVGANVRIDSTPYNVEDAEIMLLPSIYYDNNKVYARGNQLGFYAINDGANQVNLFITPHGQHFDPDNIIGNLEGLDERKISVGAGASYTYRTPIGGFRVQAATDVSGESSSVVAKAAYLTRYTSGNLTLYPSVGVAWYDDNYNDYYYGVSEKESLKTGVAQYESKSSIDPYISLNANYQFNEKWAGFFGQNITYLANEQYDSPMVVDRATYRTTLGVTYTF